MPDLEPAPEPTPTPEPADPMPDLEPESAPEPADSMPDLEPESESVSEPEPADVMPEPTPEPADTLSDEELEAVFGGAEEPEPFDTFIDSGVEDDEVDSMADLEAMEDPEPIPEVFSASDIGTDEDDEEEEAESGSGLVKLLVALLVIFIVLGGIVAGLFFGRPYVEQYVPGADKIYQKVMAMTPDLGGLTEMVGMGGSDEPGDGLAIENLQSDMTGEEGAQVLTVRGEIKNISDEPRPVPLVKISVLSAEGEELQATVVEPVESRLPPGMSLSFQGQIENPSALARDMRVEFSDAAMH